MTRILTGSDCANLRYIYTLHFKFQLIECKSMISSSYWINVLTRGFAFFPFSSRTFDDFFLRIFLGLSILALCSVFFLKMIKIIR